MQLASEPAAAGTYAMLAAALSAVLDNPSPAGPTGNDRDGVFWILWLVAILISLASVIFAAFAHRRSVKALNLATNKPVYADERRLRQEIRLLIDQLEKDLSNLAADPMYISIGDDLINWVERDAQTRFTTSDVADVLTKHKPLLAAVAATFRSYYDAAEIVERIDLDALERGPAWQADRAAAMRAKEEAQERLWKASDSLRDAGALSEIRQVLDDLDTRVVNYRF